MSDRDLDDDGVLMQILADSYCRIRCALESVSARVAGPNATAAAATASGVSSGLLSDAANELGFVINLYVLSPAVRNLVRAQRDAVKQTKVSQFH